MAFLLGFGVAVGQRSGSENSGSARRSLSLFFQFDGLAVIILWLVGNLGYFRHQPYLEA